MNVPSNYPSPDQENVYYSLGSLRNKLSSLKQMLFLKS
jgi:hypothetical protein